MSVHSTIAAPSRQQRRWLYVAAAVLGAAVIGAVLAFTVGTGSNTAESASVPVSGSAAQDAAKLPSIMSLTPAQLAAGALGTGYARAGAENGPTTASILASMSPRTRRYTEKVMSLTFAQLAAGAAGSP